jgi:hypothetical protein
MRYRLVRSRDVCTALLVGAVVGIGFNVWFNVVGAAQAVGSQSWLAQFQEPGTITGEWVLRCLYPITGYPWNVRVAVICAYGVVVLMWAVIILLGITFWRIMAFVLTRVLKKPMRPPI